MILSILGLLFRKINFFELGLLYTLVLVIFAPAIANQYLAIVIVVISAYPNIFFLLYNYLSSLLLMKDGAGLNRPDFTLNLPFNNLIIYTNIRAYKITIFALFCGWLSFAYKKYKNSMPRLKD